MKEIIAIDIDDVLAANAEGIVAYSNATWGTKLKPEDYVEHWAEMWQVDLEETERRAVQLHDEAIVKDFRHNDEALPVLQKLQGSYSLIAITSWRRSIEQPTREWIDRYYRGVFDDIQFAGIFDEPVSLERVQRTKADLFPSNNVSYVIDDQLKHCLAAAELGISTLLFGDYAWNRFDGQLPPQITRVHDWPAVQAYFDARK